MFIAVFSQSKKGRERGSEGGREGKEGGREGRRKGGEGRAKDCTHPIYSYYKYLELGTYKERKKITWLTVLDLGESREHVALIRLP